MAENPYELGVRDMVDRLLTTAAQADLNQALTGALILAGVEAKVRALPEAEATPGRDFGRGYAMAIRDVLELFEYPRNPGEK